MDKLEVKGKWNEWKGKLKQKYANLRLEYVHDNAIIKDQNIWNGLRYKFYLENITDISKTPPGSKRQVTLNFGGDVRYYVPIYRNFIWAALVSSIIGVIIFLPKLLRLVFQ